MSRPEPPSPTRVANVLSLAGWVILSFSASLSAVWVDTGGWYAGLAKPAWNPPAWVFGPVWTALYAMMAIAAWLVWRRGGWTQQIRPLSLFLVQWCFNALWTPLFFGWQRPDWALVDIGLLWLALVLVTVRFWRVSRTAGILLVPYLLWVSFAMVLNFRIWWLNR